LNQRSVSVASQQWVRSLLGKKFDAAPISVAAMTKEIKVHLII